MTFKAFLDGCVTVDLELGADGQVRTLGAIRGDRGLRTPENLSSREALGRLDEFARGARFVVGHNIVAHDRRFLEMHGAATGLLRLPLIDTLYLAPLAFPQWPYHKLLKDYKLGPEQSDPVEDCRIAQGFLGECWEVLGQRERERRGLVSVYRTCFDDSDAEGGTSIRRLGGTGAFLGALGARVLPGERQLRGFEHYASGSACLGALARELPALLAEPPVRPGAAYALAWLSVAGTESVLSRWVHHEFPQASRLLRAIRTVDCGDPACAYCRKHHDPVAKLRRYFGHPGFRAKPAATDGGSLQERIVVRGIAHRPLLAILPTGGGKSLCYQLPAILANERTGALTIVISPLQALMKDQVENLNGRVGAQLAAALNSLLTLPDRHDVLEGVRSGRFALLYVSPEQLRNRSFENAVRQREIAAWVFDEAHCIAKWGHDFRPDYLYAARFIREFSARENVDPAPVACFTATARVDVREEIVAHFAEQLGQEIEVLAADRVDRANLRYSVEELAESQKAGRIGELLEANLGPPGGKPRGVAIVYARSRRRTEHISAALAGRGWGSEHFHAGLEAPDKKRVQDGFVAGEIPVIVATNAFGMGIDKENVRLVVHADVPASIESYLQEAGRAGRDGDPAECVLLFAKGDLEKQFDLEAENRITKRDIAQILSAIRNSRRRNADEVVMSPGEILRVPDTEVSFEEDDRSAATKVKTAITWLERAKFVLRDENRTNVFQGVSAVRDLDAARRRMAKLDLGERKRRRWLEVLEALQNADLRDGLDADGLANLPAFKPLRSRVGDGAKGRDSTATETVLRTLHEMTSAGLLERGIYFTAWVRHRIRDRSVDRLARIIRVERAVADILREAHPDAELGGDVPLNLGELVEWLRVKDLKVTAEAVSTLLRGWARVGVRGRAPLRLRPRGKRRLEAGLNVGWTALEEELGVRAQLGGVVIGVLVGQAERQEAVGERLVRFSLADLERGVKEALGLAEQLGDVFAALEKTLLFLDENGVIKLEKGLAVFRQSMRIRVLEEAKGRRYGGVHYAALAEHYDERVCQIHAMGRYVREARGSADGSRGYVENYFTLRAPAFRAQYFGDDPAALERATSSGMYARIVEDLGNPAQEAIVRAPPERNLLVLAGPGSGKTRVVAHRCAYLLKIARIRPDRILVVCFNRGAMHELRERIRSLAGDTARRVAVHTYHSLALALTERSMAARVAAAGEEKVDFDAVIEEANRRLRGDDEIVGVEADELRDRLLAGFEYVLVDEYQDIDARQYELITHVARRPGQDGDERATILAVGDDDQTIYEWRKANVEFLRRFEEEYEAERCYLAENYRSTRNIVDAANALIGHNRDRMKTGHLIGVDRARAEDPPAGGWERLDKVAQGHVSVLEVAGAGSQARAALAEIERLRGLDPDPDWQAFAVLARTHEELSAVRAFMEANGVPTRWALPRKKRPPLTRVREFRRLLVHLSGMGTTDAAPEDLRKRVVEICGGETMWTAMADRILAGVEAELGEGAPAADLSESLHRALADHRHTHIVGDGVLFGTAHAAKGLEFRHVVVLGGGWRGRPEEEWSARPASETEEERRLYYVAMTRAGGTLTLMDRLDDPAPFVHEVGERYVRRRKVGVAGPERFPAVRYETLGKGDVNIDFAAGNSVEHRVHRGLSALLAGDAVELRPTERGGVGIVDGGGVRVGMLSKAAARKWLPRLEAVGTVRVLCLVTRVVEDEQAHEYRQRIAVPSWEFPILEVRST